jgi:hypothetical protein
LTKFRKLTLNTDEDMEQQELSNVAGGSEKRYSHFRRKQSTEKNIHTRLYKSKTSERRKESRESAKAKNLSW